MGMSIATTGRCVRLAGSRARGTLPQLILLVGITAVLGTAESAPDTKVAFAQVGEIIIAQEQYDEAFATAVKRTFYHGKPPEQKIAALQREVGDNLINAVLLSKEARRRGLKPDQAAVKATLDDYDTRYRASPQWQKNRDQLLPRLKQKLEEESLLTRLESDIRNATPPNGEAIRTYYAAHPEKFTQPEQLRLSVILLKVDPSSPKAKWEAALAEGQAITKKLRSGADFASLAKLHSGDATAAKGGDMGYLHRGMLPEVAQQAIDRLKIKEMSDPVTVLEGVAVFRLDERKPAKLSNFATVQQRARELWTREQGDLAWHGLIEKLRKETLIKVDESRYLPLSSGASPPQIATSQ